MASPVKPSAVAGIAVVLATLVAGLVLGLHRPELTASQAQAKAMAQAAIYLEPAQVRNLTITSIKREPLDAVLDSHGRLIYSETNPFPASLLIGNNVWYVEYRTSPPGDVPPDRCHQYTGYVLVYATSGLAKFSGACA